MSDSVRPQRWQPTRLPCPWDSPSKNTGVGCHLLLQCMKVKNESEVAQSCLILSDPMDCSLPGSSVHGIFQARALEWGVTVHIRFREVTGEAKYTEVLIKKLSFCFCFEWILLTWDGIQLGSSTWKSGKKREIDERHALSVHISTIFLCQNFNPQSDSIRR